MKIVFEVKRGISQNGNIREELLSRKMTNEYYVKVLWGITESTLYNWMLSSLEAVLENDRRKSLKRQGDMATSQKRILENK